MPHPLDPTLAAALDPAEREALERAAADDPAVARALAQWAAVRGHVREALRADLPDDRLLALHVLDADVLSDDEQARLAEADLDAVAERHPGVRAVLDRLAADRDAFETIWDEAAETSPEPVTAPRRRDRTAAPPASRTRRAPSKAWRVAVGAALVALLAVMVFVAQREPGFETVRTAAGETQSIELADGSVVHLAAASELGHAVTAEGRHVRLIGEAVFEVAPGEAPFTIETVTAVTTVLGTTFSVRADAAQTEVTLASGSVALAGRAALDAPVRLAPGERSRVRLGELPDAPERAEVVDALAWTGTWHFLATPLSEIAQRIGSHHGVRISVPPALAGERVTGAFARDVPVGETLRTLATALGVGLEGDAQSGFRFVERAR